MENNKGVTLIALIITIIVLLILAGIGITMVAGPNGILSRAQEAKTTTAEKAAKEKVDLSVSGAIARSNYGELTINNLKEEVEKYGGTIKEEKTEFPVTVIMDGKEYVVTSNGKVSKDTLASLKISNANIGDYIDLGNDVINTDATKGVTTDDWRILYVDETTNKVHVILADYLPNEKIPEGTNISKKGYSVWSNNNRDELLNYLKDTTKWSSLANGISGAEVTGGPTGEILMNSYNSKRGTNLDYTTGPTLDNADSLYVPHNEKVIEDGQSTVGYWLASPNASYALGVWYVDSSGSVRFDDYYGGNGGVRPIVCLPSEIQASKAGNVWKVEK